MQNLAEYLASERARDDVRLLIRESVGYLRVGHGTWNLGGDGAWKTAIYHTNATQQDHTVYYRLDGDRYVVTDLGEGVRALRLRIGCINTDSQFDGTWRKLLGHPAVRSYFDTLYAEVTAADLTDAICKVMLASLRVMTA